jgi:hypothetical protein
MIPKAIGINIEHFGFNNALIGEHIITACRVEKLGSDKANINHLKKPR